MLAYGYERDSEGDAPLELEQTCLTCNTAELDVLIAFLQHIHTKVPDMDTGDKSHWHFRDWDKTWTSKQADFIISLTNGEI